MFHPVPRKPSFAFGVLLLSLLAVSPAMSAETRLALVMGQSAYRAVPALPNPENDARKMAELLGNAGFDVTTAPDLAQNDMRQAVSDFAAKVAASGPDTVALVFYAGHGFQIDGENYLVPVDIDPKREADIPLQAVRLNDLVNTLGALPTRMRIFLLDACRNNPFPAINMTAGHGLALVDTKAGATGSFISFSTSPGSEAEDGNGANSPYTTALLVAAKEPNLPIEEAFKHVRVAVNKATDGRQVPWESSSLTSEFKFFSGDQSSGQGQSSSAQGGAGQGQGAAASRPPSAARSVADWRRDLQGKEPQVAYDLALADNSVEAYEAFVALFAQPPYHQRAVLLLERRRLMLAWYSAVAVNTAASFQAYLASYPDSDLAATARKMLERVRNRSLGANALASNPPIVPTNVALAPTCPCSVPPAPPLKKVDTPPPIKKVDLPAPTRRVDTPKKRRPPPEEEIVETRPSGPPPGAVMEGIGIGVGIGLGSGFGGRGGGGDGMPHTGGNRRY